MKKKLPNIKHQWRALLPPRYPSDHAQPNDSTFRWNPAGASQGEEDELPVLSLSELYAKCCDDVHYWKKRLEGVKPPQVAIKRELFEQEILSIGGPRTDSKDSLKRVKQLNEQLREREQEIKALEAHLAKRSKERERIAALLDLTFKETLKRKDSLALSPSAVNEFLAPLRSVDPFEYQVLNALAMKDEEALALLADKSRRFLRPLVHIAESGNKPAILALSELCLVVVEALERICWRWPDSVRPATAKVERWPVLLSNLDYGKMKERQRMLKLLKSIGLPARLPATTRTRVVDGANTATALAQALLSHLQAQRDKVHEQRARLSDQSKWEQWWVWYRFDDLALRAADLAEFSADCHAEWWKLALEFLEAAFPNYWERAAFSTVVKATKRADPHNAVTGFRAKPQFKRGPRGQFDRVLSARFRVLSGASAQLAQELRSKPE